jgi:probable HAF family extracellular repeat protein
MKHRVTLLCLSTLSLLALLALPNCLRAQKHHAPRYTVVDLGPVGPFGQPFHITNDGLIAGTASTGTNPTQAVLWLNRLKFDIARKGLGGLNSTAYWINNWGQAVGQAETATPDALGEDFCGYRAMGYTSNSTTCEPFLWMLGSGMTALPLLSEGTNGGANSINNAGEIAGQSENGTKDGTCPGVDPTLLQYQQTQFRPVIWKHGGVQELQNPAGDKDPDGVAFALNDKGMVVGATGTCTAFNATGNLTYLYGLNIVVWQNGTATIIKNLGGISPGGGNGAINLNNLGQVVGVSGTDPSKTTDPFHGFVWDRSTGTHDVMPIAGDVASAALSINDQGEIVGISFTANGQNLVPRAFLTVNGVPTDLNSLVTGGSPLYIIDACSINSRGEIIGFAIASDGTSHGYLAIPIH